MKSSESILKTPSGILMPSRSVEFSYTETPIAQSIGNTQEYLQEVYEDEDDLREAIPNIEIATEAEINNPAYVEYLAAQSKSLDSVTHNGLDINNDQIENLIIKYGQAAVFGLVGSGVVNNIDAVVQVLEENKEMSRRGFLAGMAGAAGMGILWSPDAMANKESLWSRMEKGIKFKDIEARGKWHGVTVILDNNLLSGLKVSGELYDAKYMGEIKKTDDMWNRMKPNKKNYKKYQKSCHIREDLLKYQFADELADFLWKKLANKLKMNRKDIEDKDIFITLHWGKVNQDNAEKVVPLKKRVLSKMQEMEKKSGLGGKESPLHWIETGLQLEIARSLMIQGEFAPRSGKNQRPYDYDAKKVIGGLIKNGISKNRYAGDISMGRGYTAYGAVYSSKNAAKQKRKKEGYYEAAATYIVGYLPVFYQKDYEGLLIQGETYDKRAERLRPRVYNEMGAWLGNT
jgi:hypothetical protein